MEWKNILGGLCILGFAAACACYQTWVYRDKNDKGPEMTGPAVVKSHRVTQGRYFGKAPSRWNYMATFALADGEQIELHTTEFDYGLLKDGLFGQLTWQGKTFLDFEAEQ